MDQLELTGGIPQGRLEEASNDFGTEHWSSVLKCPICWDYYDEPRILACGHSFCERCIYRLARTESERKPFIPRHRIRFPCGCCRRKHMVWVFERYAPRNVALAQAVDGWLSSAERTRDMTKHSSSEKSDECTQTAVTSGCGCLPEVDPEQYRQCSFTPVPEPRTRYGATDATGSSVEMPDPREGVGRKRGLDTEHACPSLPEKCQRLLGSQNVSGSTAAQSSLHTEAGVSFGTLTRRPHLDTYDAMA